MIVALTGSHSTGKSTLLELLKDWDYPNIVCIDSVTRATISDKERRIDGEVDLNQAQIEMANTIAAKVSQIEIENKKHPENTYVLDRCVFDFLAYSKSFFDRGLINLNTWKIINEVCSMCWQSIDIFFYLPIEIELVDDGVRSLDEDLRQKVDRYILDQLLWNGVKALRLEGTKMERLSTVVHTILNYRANEHYIHNSDVY